MGNVQNPAEKLNSVNWSKFGTPKNMNNLSTGDKVFLNYGHLNVQLHFATEADPDIIRFREFSITTIDLDLD